jgi:hypothetical protein
MKDKKLWTPEDLRNALIQRDKRRGETVFHIRPKASSRKKSISEEAFNRLFKTLIILELVTENGNQDLSLGNTVSQVLHDEPKFQNLVSRKIGEYLDRKGAPLQEIRLCAESINYPGVRDPTTILQKLKVPGNAIDISKEQFSQMLFLLACAEKRASRHMKIFYEFN